MKIGMETEGIKRCSQCVSREWRERVSTCGEVGSWRGMGGKGKGQDCSRRKKTIGCGVCVCVCMYVYVICFL